MALRTFSTFLILITILSNLIKISFAQTNNDYANCNSLNSSDNPCNKINKLLEPCNETIFLLHKVDETDVKYFVRNSKETKCWCNKEFYDLLVNCTTCLSNKTINVTTKPLDEYKKDCKNYGTEFREFSQTKGPNKLLLALGISALVTLLASLSFCFYVIIRKKKKSLAYEKLKSDYYHSSKGRVIEVNGRNIVNENKKDEKELYSPLAPMPPPLVHQPQQNEQRRKQSMDQDYQNSYNNFNTGIYGEQQYYVDTIQSQVPATPRESYEYYEYFDNVN